MKDVTLKDVKKLQVGDGIIVRHGYAYKDYVCFKVIKITKACIYLNDPIWNKDTKFKISFKDIEKCGDVWVKEVGTTYSHSVVCIDNELNDYMQSCNNDNLNYF